MCTFSTSCPRISRQPHKNQVFFPFFIRQIFCFKGFLGPEVSTNLNGGGEGGVGRLEWPGCTRICCEPEIRAKGDASLAREYSMAEGRVGSGRVGSGIVGWLLFKGLKSLTDKKKWRDVIQRNEIPRERDQREHVTLPPALFLRSCFPGPPQPPLTSISVSNSLYACVRCQ